MFTLSAGWRRVSRTLPRRRNSPRRPGRTDTAGKTDQQTFHAVLSRRENRYLTRQLCWVLTIQGLETYLLMPRDPADIDLLVEAIRPAPTPSDIDVVIGLRGPIAPPTMCNGLMVPIVAFDQIYSFDRDALIKAIPRPEKTTANAIRPGRRGTVRQNHAADGQCWGDRRTSRIELSGHALSRHLREGGGGIWPGLFAHRCGRPRPSPLSGTRKILDVIFAYTNRNTDFTEKSFVRVDVTEEFPFLVTKLSPYYDR